MRVRVLFGLTERAICYVMDISGDKWGRVEDIDVVRSIHYKG